MLSVYLKTVNTLGVAEARILDPPEFVSLLTSARVQSWVPPIIPGLPPVALSPAFTGTDTGTLPTLSHPPSRAPAAPPALGSPTTPSCMAKQILTSTPKSGQISKVEPSGSAP